MLNAAVVGHFFVIILQDASIINYQKKKKMEKLKGISLDFAAFDRGGFCFPRTNVSQQISDHTILVCWPFAPFSQYTSVFRYC